MCRCYNYILFATYLRCLVAWSLVCIVFCSHSQAQTQSFVRANGPFVGEVISIAAQQSQLYAVVTNADPPNISAMNFQNGIYTSADNGDTWTRLTTQSISQTELTNVRRVFTYKQAVFLLAAIGSGGGRLYRSINFGRTWTSPDGGNQGFIDVVAAGDTMIARTSGLNQNGSSILVMSTDDGATWTNIPQPASPVAVNSLASFRAQQPNNASALFGGSNGSGLFRSVDRGQTWESVSLPAPNQSVTVYALVSSQLDNIFLSTNHGVFTSNDGGRTWSPNNSGLEGKIALTMEINGGQVYAGTNSGYFRNLGAGWEQDRGIPGLGSTEAASAIIVNSSAGRYFLGTRRGVFRTETTVSGTGWEQVNRGLPAANIALSSIAAQNNVVFTSTETSGVYRADGADRWVPTNNGLMLNETEGFATRITATPQAVVVSTRMSTFVTTDGGASWQPSTQGIINDEITAFGTSGMTLFAGTKSGIIFRSINNGQSWIRTGSDFTTQVNAIHPSRLSIFAATSGGLAQSTNDGASWTLLPQTRFPHSVFVSSIVESGSLLLAGTNAGVYRSTDNGVTWTLPAQSRINAVNAIVERQGVFYAGTQTQGVFRSTDNGITWFPITSSNIELVKALLVSNDKMIVGTPTGIYESALPPLSANYPLIRSLSQDSAIAGSPMLTLTITGNNFVSGSRVEFDRQAVTVEVLPPTRIIATIPASLLTTARTSAIEVINPATASLASLSANTTFRIVEASASEPIILTTTPDSVFVNENASVRLTGRNLLGTTVFLGTEMLTVADISAEQLTVSIPARLLTATGQRTLEIVNAQNNQRTTVGIRVVTRPPVPIRLTLSMTAFTPFTTFLTIASNIQRFQISAQSASIGIKIALPSGFQASFDERTWLDTLLLTPRAADSTIAQTTVSVRFFPRDLSIMAGNKAIAITDERGGLLQELPVNAVITPLTLQVAPTPALAFGLLRVGTSTQATVRLTNPNPLTVTLAVVFAGANAADFTSNINNLTLSPSESNTVSITFAPRTRGTRSAQVNFIGAASQSLALTGEGGQAVFAFNVAEQQFSTTAYVRQRTRFPAEVLTLRNTGNMEDVVTSIDFMPPGIFSVRSFAPFRLAPNASTTLTIQLQAQQPTTTATNTDVTAVRAVAAVKSAEASTSSTIALSGRTKIFAPPRLFAPNEGYINPAMQTSTTLLWETVGDATHYEAAVSESSTILPTRVVAGSTITTANIRIEAERVYFWSARSVRIEQGDTLVVSDWQARNFFNTYRSLPQEITANSPLDFGVIAQEQITRAKPYVIVVNTGTLNVTNAVVMDDDNNAFRIHPDDLQALRQAPLSGKVDFPLRVLFTPRAPRRNPPYRALLELSGDKPIPVRVLGQSSLCRDLRNGCPQTRLEVRFLTNNKTQVAPGDTIRLQLRLAATQDITPGIERFLRRLSVELKIDNISLTSFQNALSAGDTIGRRDPVQFLPFPRRLDGKVRLEIQRKQGKLQDAVLAELTGIATIGLRNGLGATAKDAKDSAIVSILSAEWRGENGEVLDESDVILPELDKQRAAIVVNTCLSETTSLFFAVTNPVAFTRLAPQPAQDVAVLNFSLRDKTWTEIEIWNMLGQRITTVLQGEQAPGEYSLDIPTNTLPNGSYMLVLKTPFSYIHRRLDVVK